jgi:SAM-dependent methyltransferase
MPSDALPLPQFIDFDRRAPLTERIDEPCTREELRACLRDVSRLNRWFLAYRPLFGWLDSFVSEPAFNPIRILDAGCGNGDALRRVERWAAKRRIAVELTGIDINHDAVAIAAELAPPASRIRWVSADIFAFRPQQPLHLVFSTIFTHHLSDEDVVRFLLWMEEHAALGWLINDLARAVVPYHLLRIFSRIARLHPFVRHDGPVSIARSFRPHDWERLCRAAGLDAGAVSIRPSRPARLCVARRKP